MIEPGSSATYDFTRLCKPPILTLLDPGAFPNRDLSDSADCLVIAHLVGCIG